MALFLFFACQAACLMECMEGGNDPSRIEVLKLIILSLMIVFFVDILACFIILFNVSSFLFYMFVCLCACFLNTLEVIPLFCTAPLYCA